MEWVSAALRAGLSYDRMAGEWGKKFKLSRRQMSRYIKATYERWAKARDLHEKATRDRIRECLWDCFAMQLQGKQFGSATNTLRMLGILDGAFAPTVNLIAGVAQTLETDPDAAREQIEEIMQAAKERVAKRAAKKATSEP